jgi:aspartate/methionine/tyrosine aminotransferase
MNGRPPRASQRAATVRPFQVMELLARARAAEVAGRDVVHMEMGEPDFPAPPAVIEAAQRALARDQTHYSPALGLPELREAIAGFYRARYGVDVASGRIIVTPGSSGALQLVMAALLDVGDEILLPDPAYPCNRQIAITLGARAVALPVDAATDYQPMPSQVRAAWSERSRVLMLASPSNPTGSVLDASAIRGLAEAAAAGGGQLVMDEIYHGLSYGRDAPSALQADDTAFVVNSFSKYFGMTGFRVGWLVVPAEFVPVIERLAQNLFISASTLGQHAALAAFLPETIATLEQRRVEFRRRRDFLVPALRELGFVIPRVPEGAFYIYADAGRFTQDGLAFAHELLDKAGVVITPGIDFGTHQAGHHVRFAYASALPRLEEGVERLRRFLAAGGS